MIGKRIALILAAVVALLAAPALAEYPDDCLGEGEASGTDCFGTTYEGCCDGDGRVIWCDNDQLYCLDCVGQDAFCGWMGDNPWYGCVGTETGADPSGENPLACSGGCDPECSEDQVCLDGECCIPSCEDKACGDDGCGGSCGDCGPGQACEGSACIDLPVCQQAGTIACDDVVEGTTVGATSLLDGYSCESWDESGAEVGYQFNVDYLADGVTADNVVVTIDYTNDDGVDLDLFALDGACSTVDCIDGHNDEVEVDVTAGGTYFFVVDGFGGAEGAFTMSVLCLSTCEPVCKDGPCTDNGCKGLCPCETEGDVCFADECCTPTCDGLECGDDGCGGSCGACDGDTACLEGLCQTATCNGSCGAASPFGCFCDIECFDYGDCCEDVCEECPEYEEQCGPSCDPPCADGETCEGGECVPCVPDCGANVCGDDGCGGSCGECGDGGTCLGGACHSGPGCEPSGGPGCDGCACEACVCAADSYCCDTEYDGVCVEICVADCGGCPSDPVDACGDGTCAAPENCESCPADCGCEGGLVCAAGACVEDVCTADCTDKVCGDDGCGGSCGTCEAGAQCSEGLCLVEIEADAVVGDVPVGDVPAGTDGDVITGEEPKDEKSGCTTGANGNPFALMLFLSMLLAIVAIRRVNA